MALTYVRLFAPQFLAAGAPQIYQVPASPASTLLRNGRVRMVNTLTTGAVAVSLFAANGTSSGAATTLVSAQGIAPNTAMEVDLPLMSAGDTLYAGATSASAVTILSMNGVLQS